MDRPEFMKIQISLIPEDIIHIYTLRKLADANGYVSVRIEKGLPQAGILANKLLEKRLAPHGCYQCRHTPGLWRQKTRPIKFVLVVDDFSVQYKAKRHADHLFNLLKKDYEAVTVDWEASLYCGITTK